MANFISQQQRYDAGEVEAAINDFKDELQDEVEVRKCLDASTADKIAAAKKFLEDNSARVEDQLERVKELDKNIRALVQENIGLEQLDTEYIEIITSEPYVNIANNIALMNALSAELVNFLVVSGRRGRPQ
jgi:choline kinase